MSIWGPSPGRSISSAASAVCGDQALKSFLATEQAYRSARILIVSSVADAYLSLAADRENLALSRTTLQAQQESYRLIKRRFDVGLASEIDLNRAQTQVDVARRNIARYTLLVARDANALKLLVGTLEPVPGSDAARRPGRR